MYKPTDEDIEDIIDTAGYGIDYWCVRAVIDSGARTYTVTPDPELDENPKPVSVSYDELIELAVRIAEGEFEINNTIRGYFIQWHDALKGDDSDSKYASGYIDSDAADVLVQVALYGEVVYG